MPNSIFSQLQSLSAQQAAKPRQAIEQFVDSDSASLPGNSAAPVRPSHVRMLVCICYLPTTRMTNEPGFMRGLRSPWAGGSRSAAARKML